MAGKLQYWINQQVLERVTAPDGTNQYRVVSFMARVVASRGDIIIFMMALFFVCVCLYFVWSESVDNTNACKNLMLYRHA